MAGKKNVVAVVGAGKTLPNALERARNRASPAPVVKLYDHLNEHQQNAIVEMELESMLNIRCNTLNNQVLNWLAPLYDKGSREFGIPGRGRIPLYAESVGRVMGLPRGQLPVRYCVDADIEARLGPIVFPDSSSTPKISDVFEMLKDMEESDVRFKQLWTMYLVCTLLAPNTCNKVSNRVYPLLDNVANFQNMDICQFVCDKLHEELCADRVSGGCLLHMELLYVDSLDVSSLDFDLPEGRFVVNVWSSKNIDIVLNADMKKDRSGYGNLELKPHLAINLSFFGGAASFERWIETNSAPNCSKARQDKVSRLMGDFASGMTGLMANLVQGWTQLDDNEDVQMEEAFVCFGGNGQSMNDTSHPAGPVSGSGIPVPNNSCRTRPVMRERKLKAKASNSGQATKSSISNRPPVDPGMEPNLGEAAKSPINKSPHVHPGLPSNSDQAAKSPINKSPPVHHGLPSNSDQAASSPFTKSRPVHPGMVSNL